MRILVFIVIFFIFCYIKTSFAADAISPNQNLSDNGETLISSDESFELGFFSTSNSSNDRYVGIWFKKIIQQQTIVWVANRDSPIKDSSGVLTVTSAGNIVILSDGNSTKVWSSNSSTRTNNPTLQLLNSGNLVVKHGDSESFAWQSFDHPCDTQLPGMKLGMNFQTGQRWILNSWKSLLDPSTGDFTYQVDPLGVPQLVLRYRNTVSYRSGPWDGERFGGDPKPRAGPVFTPIFVFNSTHLYYTFENSDSSVISRFVVNQSGSIQHFSWNHRRNEWVNILTIQLDQCDTYAKCGPYGICTPLISPTCQCPLGFSPKIQQDWASRDFQGGCVKRPPLNCSDAAGFRKFSKMKLPDNSRVLNNSKTSSLDECKNDCLRNCSCVAYARTEASGCVVWFEDLIDIKQYGEFGQDLYIKVAASEADSDNHNNRTAVIVSVAVISGIALLAFISYLVIRRRRISRTKKDQTDHQEKNLYEEYVRDADEEDLDLPYFDLETITTATDNFSLENKIGEGGFGSVYKGVLPSEQEIAVKRLSKDSGQGLKEFKNEVILISKLQHRNLVRLLGCCIHREERMLVYEYMPNRSLDFYLFDKTRSALVNWKKRFEIIIGIARGLLYLHRDSRLRIIHRDLKASNILLDLNMSPKISDFGLARTFGADQTEANTLRIIGTYGYMSPEYAIDGQFSEKSDVFSFGVLVLEIVSGKKNRGFNHPDHDMNLLGHAWKLWSEGRSLDLVDPSLDEAFTASELLKCLQVGLLCVQQRPEDRPTMSSTLLMLDSENSLLSQPKQPGFYTERFFADKDSSSTGNASYASNEITMSMLQGR